MLQIQCFLTFLPHWLICMYSFGPPSLLFVDGPTLETELQHRLTTVEFITSTSLLPLFEEINLPHDSLGGYFRAASFDNWNRRCVIVISALISGDNVVCCVPNKENIQQKSSSWTFCLCKTVWHDIHAALCALHMLHHASTPLFRSNVLNSALAWIKKLNRILNWHPKWYYRHDVHSIYSICALLYMIMHCTDASCNERRQEKMGNCKVST